MRRRGLAVTAADGRLARPPLARRAPACAPVRARTPLPSAARPAQLGPAGRGGRAVGVPVRLGRHRLPGGGDRFAPPGAEGERVGRSPATGAGQGAVEVPSARVAVVVHDAGRLDSAARRS
ncbi:hypothetical protein EF917_09255 [Streptomyces sp. WAC00469]|nr:hypothetical protein EF917_09255 [Streptomyces sp. WAC00469]